MTSCTAIYLIDVKHSKEDQTMMEIGVIPQ